MIETKPRIALAVLTAVSVGLIIGCHLTPSMSFAQIDLSIPVLHDHKETDENKRLREQVIKDDAKKNIQDAAELLKLATDLNAQMTKDGGVQYIPAQAANETKRIEKLRRIFAGH